MYALLHSGMRSEPNGEPTACAQCAVRHSSVCGAMEDDELRDLEDMARRKAYPAHAILVGQGDVGENVFTIRKGIVRLYRLLADGRRQIVGFALPGDFIGLSLQETFEITAEAVTAVEVCRFDRRVFLACVDTKPHLLRSIHAATSAELLIGREQMVLLGRRTAEERIAAFLLTLRNRYRRVRPCDLTVWLPMTRQDIADYCGLTLETVSRSFSKLARDKIIVIVPEGVRLVRLDRLRQLAA